MDEILNKIAKDILGLDTLETRKSDSLDFKEVAVWQIKKALEAAFEAGEAEEERQVEERRLDSPN